MKDKKISFFDLDGTLTRHNTFIGFARFSVGRVALFKALLRAFPSLFLWKLGFKSNSDAKERVFSLLYGGMEYSRFKDLGVAYATFIEKDTRPEVIEVMRRHKHEGHRLLIVSASIGDWIRPWAMSEGIDEVIATEVEVDSSGLMTGRFRTRNCNGAEKVGRIKAELGDLCDCETWGYGDSSGDEAMLAFADHPNYV